MFTVSLCMIVRNEEDTLERCLTDLHEIIDEIIIVDTGSTDQTMEIAGRFTPNVLKFTWIDDFSAARNFSFAKATMDYILWLDADDVLLPEDRRKFLKLKHTLPPEIDVISMPYHCDVDPNGNAGLVVRRSRMVKRSKDYQWEGVVHEDLSIKEGAMYDSDVVVTHQKDLSQADPDRNLKIYEAHLAKGQSLSLRDTLHYAMELHQHREHEKAVSHYLAVLGMPGTTTDDRIYIYSKLADCYYYLGNRDKERECIYKSFDYDTPRPEFCCRLAYYFVEKNQFSQAAYWYKQALEAPQAKNPWRIQNLASRTWLPHMQLGLCYFNLGDYERSQYHNKMALTYRPNDQEILNNLALLEELIGNQI